MTPKPFRLVALKGWAATYENPIQFKIGDRLQLTGKTAIWDGHSWVWAIGPDGREGWIPDDSFKRRNDNVSAIIDYSAQELTCAPGDLLVGVFESHGWIWCTNDRGEAGWIPRAVVELR